MDRHEIARRLREVRPTILPIGTATEAAYEQWRETVLAFTADLPSLHAHNFRVIAGFHARPASDKPTDQ